MKLSDSKIVHVCAWAESLWHFRMPLLRGLSEVFGETVIYCPPDQYCAKGRDGVTHAQKLAEAGFTVHAGSLSPIPGRLLLAQILALARFLRRERPQALIAHQPMAALTAIPAARLAHVPATIYSTGGLRHVPGDHGLANRLLGWGEAALIGLSDGALLVNREDMRFLKRGALASRAHYVGPRGGCGIDVERFNSFTRARLREAARRELGAPPGAYIIGYIGRCVWEKGFRELIDAAALLVRRRSESDVLFLIVGTGLDLEAIRKRVAERGLARRFLFAGYSYDPLRSMSAFDAFVLPSKREGLPVSLLEAQALGLPVAATKIRGSRELIRPGINGILTEPENVEELAGALAFLVDNREAADRMGKAAERICSRRYAEQALTARTVDVVRRLVEEKINR